jgi:acetyl esterase/lipase
MPDLADYFASRGYIAVSINYRLRGDNPDGNNAALWAANDANQAFQWMVENSIEGGAYRRAYGR